ncbi:sugar ABC transporter ATP-binding protein [Truepera radiovictrix]|uniref:ABC transporter related protein n=1 Tax=Truepera radiovictrix (strain DSM 17093 / CIP 108686 / LMG 22925 / RQ-24) TaxID=649638 RepID=D7CTH5_TRURR|nr:sugar ABC transporter ATP-binding protein [Truepera radiovictrix]ADI13832.1 ABC transporter related protein [Truepera radiovictrix DSM 17093]WMT57603.1 sugar ABC transporter ATP-binding protein [Truepera radiovictrix]
MSPPPALSAQHLTRDFGSVRVLDGVSLELLPGEVHAVVGENGAGKSTLMKLLSGYLSPTAGTIRLGGAEVRFRRPRDAEARGVVLIHQEINLADDLTVEANIFLGVEKHRGPFLQRREMRARAAELLAELKTPVDPRARVGALSVSQKQMVEIAKAVSRDVRVLLMDEPTDVLTGKETAVLFRLIRRLKAQGVTVVYITHKLAEVAEIADRVSVLRDGKLVTTAPAAALTQDEMASLMVGRELSDMYPPKRPPARAEVVFAAKDVSVPGWARGVTFELRRGEVLGFAGLVGAGRTELFEGILGLRPMTGTLTRNGRPLRIRSLRDAVAARVAYVSEDRKGKGLLTELPLRPNLTLLSLKRYAHPLLDPRREQEALTRAVRTFDIRAPSLFVKAGALSGGNQQKLVLAKVMETDPEILILDEPTRGIDIGTKRQIYFFIQQLLQEGRSCILISSELPELVGLAHRVVVMRSGVVTGTLAGEAVNENEIVRYATGLKRAPDAAPPDAAPRDRPSPKGRAA